MKVFLAIGLLAMVCLTTIEAGGRGSRGSRGSRESRSSGVNSREHHKRRPHANDIARIKASLDELAANGTDALIRFVQIWLGKYPDTLNVYPQFKDVPIWRFRRDPDALVLGTQASALVVELINKVESGSHEDLKVFARSLVRTPGLFGVGLDYFRNFFDAWEWTFDTVLGYKFSRRDKESWDRLVRYALWYIRREIKHFQLFDIDKRHIRETIHSILRHHYNYTIVHWTKEQFNTYPDTKAQWPELADIPDDEFNTWDNAYLSKFVDLLVELLRGLSEKIDSTDDLRAFINAAFDAPGFKGISSDYVRKSLDSLIAVLDKSHRRKFTHRDRIAFEKLRDIVVSLVETYNRAAYNSGQWDAPLSYVQELMLDASLAQYRAGADFARFFEIYSEEFPGGRWFFKPIRYLKCRFFKSNVYIKDVIGPKIAAAMQNFLQLADDPAKLSAAIKALLITEEFEYMTAVDLKYFLEAFRLSVIEFFDGRPRHHKGSKEIIHRGPKIRSSEERRRRHHRGKKHSGEGSNEGSGSGERSGQRSGEVRRHRRIIPDAISDISGSAERLSKRKYLQHKQWSGEEEGRRGGRWRRFHSGERRRHHPIKYRATLTKFLTFLASKFAEELNVLHREFA